MVWCTKLFTHISFIQGFPGPSGQWRNRRQQPKCFSLPVKCVGLDEPGQTYRTAVSAMCHYSVWSLSWFRICFGTLCLLHEYIDKWGLTHVCKLLHISCWLVLPTDLMSWFSCTVFSLCDFLDLIGTGLFLLLFTMEMNISTSVDGGVRWRTLFVQFLHLEFKCVHI